MAGEVACLKKKFPSVELASALPRESTRPLKFLNEENENQPPLETTGSAAPPEQRRPRGRRRYGRPRYYNRGDRNDNFNEPSRNDAPGAATGAPVATGTLAGAAQSGEQDEREPEYGAG